MCLCVCVCVRERERESERERVWEGIDNYEKILKKTKNINFGKENRKYIEKKRENN